MGYQIQRTNLTEPLRFLMVLSSDHITGATGKTPTVTIAKSSGSGFITPQGTVTEIGSGWYSLSANAIDANTLGPLLLHATATACDPTDESYDVVTYNPTAFVPGTLPVGPEAISASDLINGAFEIIGVRNPAVTMPAADMLGALRRLNQIIGQWSLQSLTIPVIAREVFDLEAGRGGPDDPYTIGPNGDFDTTRPTSITGVGLQVSTGVDEPFELTRTIYTQQAYQAITLKNLASNYFNGLYFSPSFASGLAKIFLYPVPSTENQLVLYRPMQLSMFASLAATYDLPPGSHDALEYELARRLAIPYGREWTAPMQIECQNAIAVYKRSNAKMTDLGFDAALTTGAGAYRHSLGFDQSDTVKIPAFCGGSDQQLGTRSLSVERSVNLVITNSNDKIAMTQAPGVHPWVTLPTGPVRGLFAQDGRMFAVAGGVPYEVFASQTGQVLGAIAQDQRPVTFACNGEAGHQLMFSSGGLGYVFDLVSGSFVQITDDGFPNPCAMVGFCDGFGLALQASSNQFFISALEDFTSWHGLDVGQVSESSNQLVSMTVVNRNLWFLGSRTSEVWYNSGANFPFAPIQGVFLEMGNIAPASAIDVNGSLMWVTQNKDGQGMVYRSNGYSPTRVSSTAIESVLQAQPHLEDAIAWTSQDDGHTYYVLYLPHNDTTWTYDASAPQGMQWAERGIWNPSLYRYQPHIGRCHCFAFGKHLVGSRVDGTIYEMSSDFYRDEIVP